MECFCDFCGELRPTIHCKSDMARLCLSCDRHVHSANALSRRHLRYLLCDRCNSQQAMVRCPTESLSLCQNCDWNAHGSSGEASEHNRHAITGYIGCPSAAELSKLWGLDGFPYLIDSFGQSAENDSGSAQEFDVCMESSPSTPRAITEDRLVGCTGPAKSFGVSEQQSKQKPVVVQQLLVLQKLTLQSSKWGTKESYF